MSVDLRSVYFAWIDQGTAFNPAVHNRMDLDIVSVTVTCDEGQKPVFELKTRNPYQGLLAPGRKTWAWLAWDIGAGPESLIQGRIVSIPQDMLQQTISVRFIADPPDYILQQRAVAATLQELPFYDEVFLEEGRRLDPDATLEGYSAHWCINPKTLAVTVSDIIDAEDGEVVFDEDLVFHDSVKQSIDRPPLKSVYIDSAVTWTQQDIGEVRMRPGSVTALSVAGIVGEWPKPHASLGGGWTVSRSSAIDINRVAAIQATSWNYSWQNREDEHTQGDTMAIQASISKPDRGTYKDILITYQGHGAYIPAPDDEDAHAQPTATYAETRAYVMYVTVRCDLTLRYEAKRERTENVRFLMTADIQDIFTDSGNKSADFAQDSEYLTVPGKVGVEGPYGEFQVWSPFTAMKLYDYFVTDGGLYAWWVLRDHVTLAAFDQNATANYGKIDTIGDNYFNPADGKYYKVSSDMFGNAFDVPLDDPYLGPRLYQALPNFRGEWAAGATYVANDLFFGPDDVLYKTIVGHTAGTVFDRFASDITGRLVLGLMLNPPPIEDVSRRSYFPTDRGLQSLEHLILRGRAHIRYRARCLRVSFSTYPQMFAQLSLRKSARVYDPRLPGGTAVGKVISYSLVIDAEKANAICNVTIACCVGKATVVEENAGSAEYVEDAYVDPAYQYHTGKTVMTETDDISFSPIVDDPKDDRLVFPLDYDQSVVREGWQKGADQTAVELATLEATEQDRLAALTPIGTTPTTGFAAFYAAMNMKISDQHTAVAQALAKTPTFYSLTLRPVVNGPFSTEYDPTVSVLSLPKQVDLAALGSP